MTSKLRTLHVNTERTWRGGEQQALYLASGLMKRGHLVHLVAQPGSPMTRRARAAGVKTYEVRMRSEGDIFAMDRIARLMNRYQYHVVHAHTSHAHFINWFAAYIGGRPKRIVSRRVDFSIFKHPLSLSAIKYRFGADAYITVSKVVRDVLIRDGVPEKWIHVVHSGVDMDRFTPARIRGHAAAGKPLAQEADPDFDSYNGRKSGHVNPLREEFRVPEGAPVLGNVAHLAPHKGQKYFIKAIPHILKAEPSARFFIVGEGRLRGELEALSASLGLDGVLSMPGFRKDIGDFLDLFDMFVMPSVMEGLGTSVLDALARGLPVIATRVGGIPEIIEHDVSGLLVAPENAAELAKETSGLLKDPARQRRLAAAGLRKVRECFSVDAMVDKTIEVYRRTLTLPRRA